jgi:pimeloyl-ACP methyl ester carboxylesterase
MKQRAPHLKASFMYGWGACGNVPVEALARTWAGGERSCRYQHLAGLAGTPPPDPFGKDIAVASIPTLPGIESRRVGTPRLTIHALFSGPQDGVPVLFVHGNASSSTFWEETMLALPDGFRAVAPDLRGYGDTDDVLVDATRGVNDWVDDLLALKAELGIERYHAVGHSLGGSVLWGLLAADGANILSATVVAPGSPYGFGGTRGENGIPCFADYAGSGGGSVNPDFAARMAAGDRGGDEANSPRNVMNTYYWKPPFKSQREEELLSGLLSEKVGPDKYPGDYAASENWPGVAPGVHGPANAIAPKYVGNTIERLLALPDKPRILWVRGVDDQIVSDMSLFDFGTLGKLGAVPGWPGDEVFPPQPMVSQTRYVLNLYQSEGGEYEEVAFEDVGHTPYLERPEEFMAAFTAHLTR